MIRHLELIEVEPGHFTVITGGQFADMLCCDEALGVVAAFLFGHSRPYLRTYQEWSSWNERYLCRGEPPFSPAALLTLRGFNDHRNTH